MQLSKFQELLAKVKDAAARERLNVVVNQHSPTHVDLTSLGLDKEGKHPEAASILEDVASGLKSVETPERMRGIDSNHPPSLNSDNVESNSDAPTATAPNLPSEASSQSANQTTTDANSGDAATDDSSHIIGVARSVVLNAKQAEFRDLVLTGQSCVLIGAAGTGKTTSMRAVTQSLLDEKKLPRLSNGTKWLKVQGYGAAILSFTNKAVNNIRHAVVPELRPHTITAHKLLEFQPEFFEVEDPETGGMKKTMRFNPTRHARNPLPSDLVLLAWEESSMIGTQLYNLVQDAMPHAHQEIFLGDIQQLPPVFGLAVLGFKMLELPVIELTDIYRQAANSPIISLAHAILEGKPELFSPKDRIKRSITHPVTGKIVEQLTAPALALFNRSNEDGSVFFQPWQKSLQDETALNAFSGTLRNWIESGYYNPEEDIILCPFNKAFGTIEINKKIAQYLGRKRDATVWEVVAGFTKHYLAVGDRVLYDKEDATITSIAHNGAYLGARAQIASTTLDRWGHHQEKLTQSEVFYAQQEAENREDDALDLYLTGDSSAEDRVHAASHIVTVQLRYATDIGEEPEEIVLDSAAAINSLLGGYALTVHKFQGSEAGTVILCLHQSHATMVSRELLYTAVTRARNKLHIICEFDTFFKGVASQRIKGDTLAEKAEFFKGKRLSTDGDASTPLLSTVLVHLKTPSEEPPQERRMVGERRNSEEQTLVALLNNDGKDKIQSALEKLRALSSTVKKGT